MAAGAEVVVPDMAREYHAKISCVKFATYPYVSQYLNMLSGVIILFGRGEPYVAETANFRVTYIHVEGGVHAQDHSTGLIMPTCPTTESSIAISDADHVVQGDLLSTHNNYVEIAELIAALTKHRVAKSAL